MISLILSASLSKANAQISISHQIMPSLFLTHSLNKCDDQDHRINISLSPLFSVLFLSLTSPCTPPPSPSHFPTHPHPSPLTPTQSQVQQESGRSLLQKPRSESGEMISKGPETCWVATDLATASTWIWDSMIWLPPEHMMLKAAVMGLLCGSGTDTVDDGVTGEINKTSELVGNSL